MSELGIRFQTVRLELIASTEEHLRTELETPERIGGLLGAEVPVGWPPGFYDRDAMKFFLERLTQGGAAAMGWYGWYAVRRAAGGEGALLVASGGYFGPPAEDGTVEIGYSVVGSQRGQGYGSEVAEGLTARALGMAGVERVVAEVHTANVASLKVMERCGFAQVGAGREAGYLRFERRRPSV